MTEKSSDGLLQGFGEIVQSLYKFACSVELTLFDIDFTLWDVFFCGMVIALIATIWHGFTN